MREGTTTFRVRYMECDPMGVAHHSVFPIWFEIGRTELLREDGVRYRDVEELGYLLAVVKLDVVFKRPARYDDLLTLTTSLLDAGHIKIRHAYVLRREHEVIATGSTTLACIDARTSRAIALPEVLVRHARGELQSETSARPIDSR